MRNLITKPGFPLLETSRCLQLVFMSKWINFGMLRVARVCHRQLNFLVYNYVRDLYCNIYRIWWVFNIASGQSQPY